jgi:hypothetical protein
MPTGSVVRPSATAIEDPDGGWVAKARAGDLDASEVLVRHHGQMIYRFGGNPRQPKRAVYLSQRFRISLRR